jgi:hypothetical protein
VQSNAARIAILIAVVAAAVALFVVLGGGDDDGEDEATTAATTGATTAATPPAADLIRVRNGEPIGGVQRLTYDRGDEVRINVELDQPAEEIHVHGYEISEPADTSPVRLSFSADIDGLFEVEAHSHEYGDVPLAELRVNP